MLDSVQANDYHHFMIDTDDAFKAAMTKEALQSVSTQLAPRLQKGYTLTFLGELSQQSCQVSLWKVTYKDGSDDTLAKLAMKDGRIAGFWLQ